MTIDNQRQLAIINSLSATMSRAKVKFAVTVTKENIEVTVTVEDKKSHDQHLDLNNIKQLVTSYLATTDETNFDSMINYIYSLVYLCYPERDIEVMIYDTVECLTVMKIFNFNQPAI